MFCIFIGVTFANLGREGRESGKMRDPICYAQKRTTITKTNAPTYHKPVHKIGNINTKQIIYDDASSYYECNLRQDSAYSPQ